MPLNPFQMQDLADVLFPSDNVPSSSSFNVTAQGDSSNGVVSVENDGDVVAIPIIGSASAGDELPVLNVGGVPIAIATDGWGDQLNDNIDQALEAAAQAAAATAYVTHIESGDDAGVHVHENADDYNTGGDFWINPVFAAIRKAGKVVAKFAENAVELCSGIAKFSFDRSRQTGDTYERGTFSLYSFFFPLEGDTERNASRGFLNFEHNLNDSDPNKRIRAVIRTESTIDDESAQVYQRIRNELTIDGEIRPHITSYKNIQGNVTIRNEELALLSDIPSAPERLPYCKAVRTASATTSATAAAIADLAMQSLEMNYSRFSILGGAVIVPKAGRIKIHGAIHYSSYSSSVARGCYIKRNGAEVCGSYAYGTNVVETDAFINVNAGDTISIASRASSASQAIDYKSGGNYTNTYLFVEYMDVV